MPSIQWKNQVYKAVLPILRPIYNYGRIYSHPPCPQLKKLIQKHMIQRGTLVFCENDKEHVLLTGKSALQAEKAWYHVASIAKLVTAVGTLKLSENGLVDLHRPVNEYLPLEVAKDITLFHLLTHSSGLTDNGLYHQAIAKRLSLDQWITNEPQVFAAGSRFQYSNLGFGLVGSVLEEVTGSSLEALMQELIFKPHGIDATYDLTTLPSKAQVVCSKRLFPVHRGYALDTHERRSKASPIDSPDPMCHYGLASGGLFATAEGLSRFVKALMNGSLLSKSSLEAMARPLFTLTFDGYKCGFGMGLFVICNPNGHQILGHQGFAYGAVHGLFWDTQSNKFFVSLNGGANEERIGRLGSLNLDLINCLLGDNAWI